MKKKETVWYYMFPQAIIRNIYKENKIKWATEIYMYPLITA